MNRILLIDDERPILDVLSISLESEGYVVKTAEGGLEGLKLLEEECVQLVVTDIKMPGMDGIEVLRKIKASRGEVEVIVITGHGDMDSAVAALRNGASDFLTKPIHEEALLLALERAKERIRTRRLLQEYTHNLEQKCGEYTAELRRAHQELVAQERLATIGETVAGLAHYMKNILNGLRGGVYKVNSGLGRDDRQRLETGWEMVQRNIGKMSDLVAELLYYAKEREPERVPCRLNDVVLEVVGLIRLQAESMGVAVRARLDPGLGEAPLDPKGLHSLILNLATNALDACRSDPNRSKSHHIDFMTRRESGGAGNEWLLLQVSDNGCGMEDAVRERIFTRFFSTKGGQGTGLGLLVSRKIVREHGGEIALETERGVGTTFTVRLPVVRAQFPASE
jgi:signal transduction histidine kinase